MNHPFLYIASLRRTGSTVLSEALTRLPHAFIFREPGLGRGRFALKPADRELFEAHGLDLKPFAERLREHPDPAGGASAFRDELLPGLLRVAAQIGVKEIFHDGWRAVHQAFPAMKVLLTGRDPRDIYLSLHERVQKSGGRRWSGPFNPQTVAADLERQFRLQLELQAACDSMRVRYEDFCRDPELFEEVKRFCGSPVPAIGDVGGFNRSNPKRTGEAALHEDRITERRSERWKREPDPELRRQACRMVELMPAYCEFWGYA